jgi:hypothetical protein
MSSGSKEKNAAGITIHCLLVRVAHLDYCNLEIHVACLGAAHLVVVWDTNYRILSASSTVASPNPFRPRQDRPWGSDQSFHAVVDVAAVMARETRQEHLLSTRPKIRRQVMETASALEIEIGLREVDLQRAKRARMAQVALQIQSVEIHTFPGLEVALRSAE